MSTDGQSQGMTDLEAVERQRGASGHSYLECLRVASMSAGLYSLAAGSVDPQSPHGEDEFYYVVRGRAKFRSGDEERSVATGSLILAAKSVHRFFDIAEDLQILIFFAPAETA
jgi:mannose-6-phosphate isomerase-like protein (cupin superfamily)